MIMNEEHDWSHSVEGDAVEGSADHAEMRWCRC